MLYSSAEAFNSGNEQLGIQNFRSVKEVHKGKVYEQLWVDRGRPQGNFHYGEQAFNETNGLYSTNYEKAMAINSYLHSVVDSLPNAPSGSCEHYEYKWNTSTGKYELNRVVDWNKWGEQFEDIFPKPYDPNPEAKLFGVGIVGTAIIMCIGHCLFKR